jgi:fido (protein-threonine AMPylation protein)
VSDEADRLARERADFLSFARIRELYDNPIKGDFDAEHLKAVHAYIFQDSPEHQPGVTREDTKNWIKTRGLEGSTKFYDVHYAHEAIDAKITETLQLFGGAEAIKGLTPETAAARIAELYGDLDYAHGFYEGNSRTLREFTRELALEAGYNLDWTGTDIGTKERNELYLARDLAVLERAYPDPEFHDRAEYEASFVIRDLHSVVGDRTLAAIIGDGLSVGNQIERVTQRGAGTMPDVRDLGDAVEAGVANLAEGVAGIAEDAIDTLASSFESLFGGSSPAPAPAAPQESNPAPTLDEYVAAQRAADRQRAADLQAVAAQNGNEAEAQDEAEKQNKHRSGGQSV